VVKVLAEVLVHLVLVAVVAVVAVGIQVDEVSTH
jgi:hypothetical protein